MAWIFGGATLANALPHLVSGLTGRPFQTPFADPPGVGLSSPMANLLWGFGNLAVAWLLGCRVGAFDLRDPGDAGALGGGMLAIGLFAARHFGASHGREPGERA